MSEPDNLHPTGISTTDKTPGWVATMHNGDGTATNYWAPTEKRAVKKAKKSQKDE